MFDVVCADCGINVPWEDQYCVPGDDGQTNIVCPECAKKYGYNLDDSPYDENQGEGFQP